MFANRAARFSRRDSLRLLGAAGAVSLLGGLNARADEPASALPANAGANASAKSKIANPGFYRFNVGDVELTIVADGAFAFSSMGPIYPLFGANASKEAVEQSLTDHFVNLTGVTAPVHALVIKTGRDTVLVDSGCGSLFGPATGKLPANLAAAGIAPTDINAVLLTHAHGDHFGGLLGADGKPAFANADPIIAKAELDFWTGAPDLSKSGLPAEMHAGFIASAQKALGAIKWTQVEGEKEIRSKIRVIPAPGHTPGHLTLLIDGGGTNQLYYITDAVHHFAIVVPHPEYYVAFDTDRDLGVATRKKILDRAAADRVLVAGSHLPFPGVGHVKRSGDGFEWAPAVWEW